MAAILCDWMYSMSASNLSSPWYLSAEPSPSSPAASSIFLVDLREPRRVAVATVPPSEPSAPGRTDQRARR